MGHSRDLLLEVSSARLMLAENGEVLAPCCSIHHQGLQMGLKLLARI